MKIGISILSIIIAMLSSLGITSVNESNIEDYVSSDCNSVADFIEDNFDTFVYEYNGCISDDSMILNATYIEAKVDVTNVTNNTKAVYLDFDGDNGYAVIGNDYMMLDFAISGDLSYLKNENELLFSEFDGFVYETEYGYARYDFEYPDEDYWDDVELNKFYNGQNQSKGEGSGYITDSKAYIADRYGSGFTALSPVKLAGYTDVYQNNYNNYSKTEDGITNGEGNCTLSAMCGIMQYLRDNKSMSKIPDNTKKVTINPTNDSFYTTLINKGYSAKIVTVPETYSKIREKAIGYGYKAESTAWTSINMANIYMDVMNDCGYSTNIFKRYAYLVLTWSFESQVKTEIDAGYPTMWNTARGQYGSHSMVVKGYQQFYKEHKIWFIKWREYKNLMILNDNWNAGDMYFDLDAYGCNLLSEGFGTFLKVRNYAY